jgi:metallo-beta-lactamase family protein
MCESGRILHHLKNNLNDPRTTVLIVGFMAEGTLGRRLQEGFSPVKVLGDYVEVKAKIVDLGAFSAHADYGEELEYLADQTVRKAVYLVHGEPAAQASLRQKLLDAKVAPIVEAAKLNQTIEL